MSTQMVEGESRPGAVIVVVNHEEQYSIWPADSELPGGWKAEGFAGTKEECLQHVERVWVDMRPLSLRRAMGDAT